MDVDAGGAAGLRKAAFESGDQNQIAQDRIGRGRGAAFARSCSRPDRGCARKGLRMATTILITGFGPFPGAPKNPTGPLARTLARRRRSALADTRRIGHVFRTSYASIEKDLPVLLRT